MAQAPDLTRRKNDHTRKSSTGTMESIMSVISLRWLRKLIFLLIALLALYLNTAYLPSVEKLRDHEEIGARATNAAPKKYNVGLTASSTSANASQPQESLPNYYSGRFQYQFDPELSDQHMQNAKVLYLLDHETPALIGNRRIRELYDTLPNKTERQLRFAPRSIPTATDTWVLPAPLRHPTRNHDTIVLPDSVTKETIAIHLLGRHSRYVQWMNMETGVQKSVRTRNSTDPDGWPLDDLNHVSAVLVRGVHTKAFEIWLPCGFHGDKVNGEFSANYVRIVDVVSLQVRTGPKLPESGGACIASSAEIIKGEPPMVCVAGGTDGTHDRGRFIRQTYCYDRVRSVWHSPFGMLPYGLDHGSLAVIEPGVCHPDDPGRWLILNFRTKPYGDAHSEILAFDLPKNGWSLDELQTRSEPEATGWYIFYNKTTEDDFSNPETVGRDASGIYIASKRHIVNIGGTYHFTTAEKKRKRGRFSMIRSFDICVKKWTVIGDLGLRTFALQSAVINRKMGMTCGGEAPMRNSNGHWCFLTRFHNGMELENRYLGPF